MQSGAVSMYVDIAIWYPYNAPLYGYNVTLYRYFAAFTLAYPALPLCVAALASGFATVNRCRDTGSR